MKPEYIFVAAMWVVAIVVLGPVVWRLSAVWRWSCPIINHLDGCDCPACEADAPRVVNGEWRNTVEEVSDV